MVERNPPSFATQKAGNEVILTQAFLKRIKTAADRGLVDSKRARGSRRRPATHNGQNNLQGNNIK